VALTACANREDEKRVKIAHRAIVRNVIFIDTPLLEG
jgi:hypothetical protein